MSKYIKKISCQSCGSSKTPALAVYEDGTGYCWSCNNWFSNPYKGTLTKLKPPTRRPSLPESDIFWIKSYAGINDLKDRGINKAVADKFQVRSVFNESTGNLESHFYPYYKKNQLVAYKKRIIKDKVFYSIGDLKGVELFGQNLTSPYNKYLIIVEGECDVLAGHQILVQRGKHFNIVSPSTGASLSSIKENYEFINSFDNILLCLDPDKPGVKLTREICELFPIGKVKVMTISEKDPNEMLNNGKGNEFVNAIFSANPYRPDGIVSVEDIEDKAMEPVEHGLSWPWKPLTEATYGIRRGEIYGFGGGTGSGKCLEEGTKIRMFNGDVKKVEDIQIGDLVLDPLGTSTQVQEIGSGKDYIYEIKQSDNTSYRVNSQHILSVINSKNKYIDIPIKEAIGKRLYGYNGIAKYRRNVTLIDPYILGIWLGDGHNSCASLTCGDTEVLISWCRYGLSLGLRPTEYRERGNCRRINLSDKGGPGNIFYSKLKHYSLPFNKHIPNAYLISNILDRRQILAGILDTDGHLVKNKTAFEFTSRYEKLGKDVESLCRSLGLRVRHTIKKVNNKDYRRLYISGNLTDIPVRVERKGGGVNGRFKSRIVSIEKIGIRKYYGFVLNQNKRFCLENYTVTHNTEGFKEIILHLCTVHDLPAGVIFLEEPVEKTLKVIAGKNVNKRFHIPDDSWSVQELRVEIEKLKGKLFLYDHQWGKNWEKIKNKISYMVISLGIKDIFLDHLTALVAQEDNEYKSLNRIMDEMASLAGKLNCTIYFISHLRKSNGIPHEEGGRVTIEQFHGSSAITKWSHFVFGYERNQQAEDFEERNTTLFRILKDRYTGLGTGITFKLCYNHNTGRWLEKIEEDFEEIL